VADLDGFIHHLRQQDIPLAGGPEPIEVIPGNNCKVIALRSPDGCWLEFYQAEKAAGSLIL
jgi:hypothetical protein